MINSLILMLSQYNKNGKFPNIFKCIWLVATALMSFSSLNFTFLLIEIVSFLLMSHCTYFFNRFSFKFNALLSVFSVLVYSVFVDIMCYFLLSAWCGNQSLIQYIMNGIIFNSKYVLSNGLTLIAVTLVSKYLKNYLDKHLESTLLLFKTKSHN